MDKMLRYLDLFPNIITAELVWQVFLFPQRIITKCMVEMKSNTILLNHFFLNWTNLQILSSYFRQIWAFKSSHHHHSEILLGTKNPSPSFFPFEHSLTSHHQSAWDQGLGCLVFEWSLSQDGAAFLGTGSKARGPAQTCWELGVVPNGWGFGFPDFFLSALNGGTFVRESARSEMFLLV